MAYSWSNILRLSFFIQDIVQIYKWENIQKTIENYRRAVEMQPQSPELRGKLAAAYGLVCDLPKAKEEVAMAVALDSNYRAAADQFFRELAERCKK